MQPQADAIRRRAVHRPACAAAALDRDRGMRRHLVPAAGLLVHRRDDHHFGEDGGRALERQQPGGVDAIIVGQQHSQRHHL
jgi:hypothetical protein